MSYHHERRLALVYLCPDFPQPPGEPWPLWLDQPGTLLNVPPGPLVPQEPGEGAGRDRVNGPGLKGADELLEQPQVGGGQDA